MTTDEMLQWLEASCEQGRDLGHNAEPILGVIAKLRAAEELVRALKNDGTRLKSWHLIEAYERAGASE